MVCKRIRHVRINRHAVGGTKVVTYGYSTRIRWLSLVLLEHLMLVLQTCDFELAEISVRAGPACGTYSIAGAAYVFRVVLYQKRLREFKQRCGESFRTDP